MREGEAKDELSVFAQGDHVMYSEKAGWHGKGQ